jgi:hypothetical protein
MATFNPQFLEIGQQFIQAYYQVYDTSTSPEERAEKLAPFYHVREAKIKKN